MRKVNGLFLTTVLMIVLLIVALSTATFAWFSASNVVNIATISFIAKSKTEGTGEQNGTLKLSWQANCPEENLLSEISIKNGTEMAPMIPKNQPVIGETTYEDFLSATNFYTAVEADVEGTKIYASGPIAATPYTCANPTDDDDTTFYLYNTGNYPMAVTLNYDFDGDNAAALRIAVFVDGTLTGIMAEGSVSYGTIVKNTEVLAQTGMELTERIGFTLAANGNVAIKLVAWYDGKFLGDDGATKAAELKDFSFSGAYVAG